MEHAERLPWPRQYRYCPPGTPGPEVGEDVLYLGLCETASRSAYHVVDVVARCADITVFVLLYISML